MTTLLDVPLHASTHQAPALPHGGTAPPPRAWDGSISVPALDGILKKDTLALSSREGPPERTFSSSFVLPLLPVDLGLPSLILNRSVSVESYRTCSSSSSHATRLRHLAMGSQDFAAVLRLIAAHEEGEGCSDGGPHRSNTVSAE